MREIASPLSGPFTTFGQTPIDIYKVGAYRPELAYSFYNEYYRRGRQPVNFLDAITHTRNGNATMVDSDGVLKWAPHNLLKSSEDFSDSNWTKTDTTVTSNAAAAPDGTITADKISHDDTTALISQNITVVSGTDYRAGVLFKYVDHQWVAVYLDGTATWFDIQNGVIGTDNLTNSSITALSDGWYYLEASYTAGDALCTLTVTLASADNSTTETSGTSAYIWGAHVYRSDLGGMVDNPDRGDSYVPTTSSAVYLPRRGHHVYNGSQWVNKGLLHESEQRTNLLLQSQDLSNVSVWANINTPTRTDNGDDSFTIGDDSASAFEGISQSVSITSGSGTYTASVQVKKTTGGTSKTVALNFRLTGGTQVLNNVRINTDTGEVVNSTTADVVDAGTYWIVCASVTDNSSGNNLAQFDIYPATANHGGGVDDASAVGSATFRYPQLEAGSTPSSYIPTNGATVTRPAESITIPAANLPWPNPVYVTNEELVTNGTFDSDTSGWTADTDTSISAIGGSMRVELTSGTNPSAVTSVATEAGKVYKFQVEITGGTQSGWRYLRVGSTVFSSSIAEVIDTSNGTSMEVIFVASGPTTYITVLHVTSTVGQYLDYDNISVKEINPLSVSIQMKGEMTYADTGVYTETEFMRWQIDAYNYLIMKIDTFGANTGKYYAFARTDGVNLGDEGGAAEYTSGIDVPFNVAGIYTSTRNQAGNEGIASSTPNTRPTRLIDLSSTDLDLAYDFMGTISLFRMWANDLGDAGIEEASEPSTQATLFLSFDGSNNSYVDFDWSE